MYCEHDHSGMESHIVWGGTRQKLVLYPNTADIIDGITPHIISFVNPDKPKVAIACTCGVIGCGVSFKDNKNIHGGIIMHEVKNMLLDQNDFQSLIDFKHTGYELLKQKRCT